MIKSVLIVTGLLCVTYVPGLSASGPFANLPASEPDKTVIATLFEWKHEDVADECEQYLGPNGFAAVQVSPVMEYAIIKNPEYEPAADRPWYERYQPVGYKAVISRSGDEEAFRSMVERCNNAGVRVIVDVVLNHMAGEYDGMGCGGTPFVGKTGIFFPGVPFSPEHFTPAEKCKTEDGWIHDWDDREQVRSCKLRGLHDLDSAKKFVQEKQKTLLNKLIGMGVAGFRVDSAKHIAPEDLQPLFDKLKNLKSDVFPVDTKPFIINGVNPGGAVLASEYVHLGRVQAFDYRQELHDAFRNENDKKLASLKDFGTGFVAEGDAVALVDNHEIQRAEPENGISFRAPKLNRLATAFMLAWPYGLPNIMSSYEWPLNIQKGKDLNSWMGPPADAEKNINSVVKREDGTCEAPWVCEHRFKEIPGMIIWRKVAEDLPVQNWYDNGGNAIAFSRGENAFIAINNEEGGFSESLKTGLPAGKYCDVITGSHNYHDGGFDEACTGKSITVDEDGVAEISFEANEDVPAIAFHVRPKWLPPPPTTTTTLPPPRACYLDTDKSLTNCVDCVSAMKHKLANPEPECTFEDLAGLDKCYECFKDIPRMHDDL